MDPARRHVPLIALLLLACAPFAPAQQTAPFPREGERIAAAECARCHERQHRRLLSGGHAAVLDATVLPGCETCHGPGAAHAADRGEDLRRITMPPELGAEQQTRVCGQCHADQIRLHGGDPAGFVIGGHTCTDCHAIHGSLRDRQEPHVTLRRRFDVAAHATAVGSDACRTCHPLRDQLLAQSPHAALAAANSQSGCETCHGEGSRHTDHGEGRWITRPDRALDGVATCRTCHTNVDATRFHWVDRDAPFLSEGMTCTTCHVVHAPATAAVSITAAWHQTNRACATCHAAAFATMPTTGHRDIGALDTQLTAGCGACHVGAAAHAASGGRRDLLVPWDTADAQAEVCLSCHSGERTLAHVRRGAHLRHGVRCSDCHGPVHAAHAGDTAATAEARCANCHPDVAAAFRLPNHHPVPEGRMGCSSCHDVHGEGRAGGARDRGAARCVDCHARYRGPFAFAHQADRRGGCVVCHTPHGSSNRVLLRQADTQQNCLQCHADFPAFHDQTPGAVFTNCIRCHTEVHGSNHSRYLFR